MSKASPEFMASLPDDALLDMVRQLHPSTQWPLSRFWAWHNGKKGYCSDPKVFQYALLKAGMEIVPGTEGARSPLYRKGPDAPGYYRKP